MWLPRAEVDVSFLPHSFSSLVCETASLTRLEDFARLASQQVPRTCLCLHGPRITGAASMPFFPCDAGD